MKTWMLNNRRRLAETSTMTMVSDNVSTPSGAEIEYVHMTVADSVLVVPIKVVDDKVSFIMVQQYRYPVGKTEYEFPGGGRAATETTEQAAKRELLEETGYGAKKIKFSYVLNTSPAMTSAKTYVYLAVVDGDPAPTKLDATEVEFGLVVKEYTADELLKLLRDNEITDGKTVAALATVLLQSPKALEYANSLTGEK